MQCEICGSERATYYRKRYDKILCNRHNLQMNRNNGEITLLEDVQSFNQFIFNEDDTVSILLYDRVGNIKATAIIDAEDYEKVKDYRWCLGAGDKYAIAYNPVTRSKIRLHRLLVDGEEIDHWDKDKLNNRRNNLRDISHQQNGFNSSISKNNKSGICGVCWHSKTNKWRSYLTVDKIQLDSHTFDTFDDAVKQRIISESNYFKEFSPNYNPQTQTIQLTYKSHDDELNTFIEADLSGTILTFTKLTE